MASEKEKRREAYLFFPKEKPTNGWANSYQYLTAIKVMALLTSASLIGVNLETS
jgi:hypothetical protein